MEELLSNKGRKSESQRDQKVGAMSRLDREG